MGIVVVVRQMMNTVIVVIIIIVLLSLFDQTLSQPVPSFSKSNITLSTDH